MLDEQDRQLEPVAHLPQELGEGLRLRGVEPRRRLVEQEQLGLECEGAGQLEALLRAQREIPGRLPHHIAQTEQLEELLRLVADQALLPVDEGQGEALRENAGPHVAVAGHQDIVERAHAAEELHVLEGARDPEAGDLIGPQAGQILVPRSGSYRLSGGRIR